MEQVLHVNLVADVGDPHPVEDLQLDLLIDGPREGYGRITTGEDNFNPVTKGKHQQGVYVGHN